MNRPVTRVAAHHGVPVTPDPIGSALGQLRVVLDVRPQRVLDHRIDRIEVTGLFVWRPGGLLDLGQGCRGVMTDAADVYSYCSLGDAFGYGRVVLVVVAGRSGRVARPFEGHIEVRLGTASAEGVDDASSASVA
jgi:hypothetical protein